MRINKRDIRKEINYNGEIYQFEKTLDGTYNKANIYKKDNKLILLSYDTVVAQAIEHASITAFGWYSATTARHINKFFKEFGIYKGMNKKELEDMGQNSKYLYLD